MSVARRTWSKGQLALVGFLGHAPGLRLVARARFAPGFAPRNLVALALTLAAMVVAGVGAPPGSAAAWVLVAWLIGHFAWSLILAGWILAGGALQATVDGRRG